MPTSAVTGTKTARKAAAKKEETKPEVPDLSGEDGYVEPDAPEAQELVDGSGEAPEVPKPEAQPLADPSGNGSIQATAADGSTINVDGCEDGWEARIREQNPAHPALKYVDDK